MTLSHGKIKLGFFSRLKKISYENLSLSLLNSQNLEKFL